MTVKVDRRQLIIDRLGELLSALTIQLTGGETAATIPAGNYTHNRDELPAEKVPGLILLDGDEVRDQRFPEMSGRSSRPGPGGMKMTPEIYVVLDVRKPQNTNVGEDLNLARAAILELVLHDVALQQITGAQGSIVYSGSVTDLARNRTMRGQLGVAITFSYPFIPDELTTA